MDSSLLLSPALLINQAIVTAFIFLFWKLLSSRFNWLTMLEANCNGSRNRTLASTPGNPKASSSTFVDCDVSCEYEVFLSFRGGDTRKNFIGHLYKELKTKGIHAFKDDNELERGKKISYLLKAIEKSEISIVVLSPNYACSSWCLDELVKIIECSKARKQIVLPIFYHIDPSDIEKQIRTLERTFPKLRKKKFGKEKIRKWKHALSTVANIAGWDAQKRFDGDDAALIESIGREVADRFIRKLPSVKADLLGIDSQIMDIDEKLRLGRDDVRTVGIWGTGGIGKTTLAEFVYHRDYDKYEACCYLKNIKDKYKKDGAIGLQKDLLSQILLERHVDIWNENVGRDTIFRRLRGKKVLIVLDDIDELEELEFLPNDVQWFGGGSRILITTRDKRLLVQHEVEYIHEVPTLERDKALQLFSLHAFGENQPPDDFLELSNKFVSYAEGLPLALKILGLSLKQKEKRDWERELEKLKKIPNAYIYRIMRISYDRLDDFVKSVFLDIAFFLTGKNATKVIEILNRHHVDPQLALAILQQKALLTISDNILEMHELIKMMGHEIVREEASDPNERSRISDAEDAYDVLTNFREATSIEGVSLNMSELRRPIYLDADVFNRFRHLRILSFESTGGIDPNMIHLPRGLNFLPSKLKYFRWDYFPLKTFSSNIDENLVELILRRSKIEYLWDGEVELSKLRIIDLSYSRQLEALPNISNAPCLEEINLEGCESFHEFSFDLEHLYQLKILTCRGCKELGELPALPPNLVELDLSYSGITELPSKVQSLTKLEVMKLDGCRNLRTLSVDIGALKSLSSLSMCGSSVEELPQSFLELISLVSLELRCIPLGRLPENIGEMKWLREFILEETPIIINLPESTGELQFLRSLKLKRVAITELPRSIGQLKSLESLVIIEVPIVGLPGSIGRLRELLELKLIDCTRLMILPRSLSKLVSLQDIEIKGCKSLHSLPEFPSSLVRSEVESCESLETLRCNDWNHFRKLRKLMFVGCHKLVCKTCSEIMEHARVIIEEYGSERFEFIVPGNKIPDWFHYQSRGSSITTKLPLFLHQIRGFAFSVVYDLQKPCRVYGRCAARSDLLGSQSEVDVEGYGSGTSVMVWYKRYDDPRRDVVTTYLGCNVQFDLSSSTPSSESTSLKVKKWGVYVIPDEEAFARFRE